MVIDSELTLNWLLSSLELLGVNNNPLGQLDLSTTAISISSVNLVI